MLSAVPFVTACATGKANTYGGLPSYLPTSTTPVNRVLNASAADPQLGIEGDSITASLSAGRVVITVVGPEVPAQGLSPPPSTSPATFTVSLRQSVGNVPLAAAEFAIVDGAGAIHHPHVVPGDGPVPDRFTADGTTSFRLADVLATGPGTIRWSPEGRPVASWDFTLEVD